MLFFRYKVRYLLCLSMFFKALFDFKGRQDDELTFKTGDLIVVLHELGQDWRKGEFTGKIGILPKSYVTMCV